MLDSSHDLIAFCAFRDVDPLWAALWRSRAVVRCRRTRGASRRVAGATYISDKPLSAPAVSRTRRDT
jgi:hypothetical protein